MKVTFSVFFFFFFLQGYKGFETKRKLPFYFWNYRSAIDIIYAFVWKVLGLFAFLEASPSQEMF